MFAFLNLHFSFYSNEKNIAKIFQLFVLNTPIHTHTHRATMNIQPNTDLGIFASLPRVNLAPLLVGGTQVLANPSRGSRGIPWRPHTVQVYRHSTEYR